MHRQLIASPYPDGHIVVSPGRDGGIRIGSARYSELRHAHAAALVPSWLAAPARAAWNLDLTDRNIGEAIIIRPETKYGYARASYELNLGCNYDCEHCYLGEKKFAGLDWLGRERLLQVMADAGVLWLQLTGGEPLIDPLFPETHARAWDMGMMIQISSNGSRLDQTRTLEILTERRPYRLTLSIYGATEESYDGMTRRRGSFRRFMRGLAAAREAGLPMRINIVVSNRNALQRRDHPLPRRSPRPGLHLQGRPRPASQPDHRGARGTPPPGSRRGLARHPPRRVLRLHPPQDVRDLHAASQPLPAGQGSARNLLPARRKEVNRP
jgi:uncharacterized Fe-S cluster-containing radical SAM superfamily protein